jgi:hypothetical protein
LLMATFTASAPDHGERLRHATKIIFLSRNIFIRQVRLRNRNAEGYKVTQPRRSTSLFRNAKLESSALITLTTVEKEPSFSAHLNRILSASGVI